MLNDQSWLSSEFTDNPSSTGNIYQVKYKHKVGRKTRNPQRKQFVII